MLQRFLESTAALHGTEFWRPIIQALVVGAESRTDVRGAAQCARTLAMLRAQDIGLAQEIDRQQRLDGGEPTDRVTLRVQMDRNG
jgi:hypothetical protein